MRIFYNNNKKKKLINIRTSTNLFFPLSFETDLNINNLFPLGDSACKTTSPKSIGKNDDVITFATVSEFPLVGNDTTNCLTIFLLSFLFKSRWLKMT